MELIIMRGVKGSGKVEITCLCGNKFTTAAYRLKVGRGKYCSKACKNKYFDNKVRKGRKVVFKNPISSWFKKGIQNNPNGEFKKGQKPIYTPPKGIRLSPDTEFKKGEQVGNQNHNWKGAEVGYHALHTWLERTLGRASKCQQCQTEVGRIEWANKSHEYKRDADDWMPLCKKCHIAYDRGSNSWGLATKKFDSLKKQKKQCQP